MPPCEQLTPSYAHLSPHIDIIPVLSQPGSSVQKQPTGWSFKHRPSPAPHPRGPVPTSEPEGEAGTLAAGEVGLLVLSGKSNDRSLLVKSRGFFFFSASRSLGSEPEWLSARVRTPVRKSAISSYRGVRLLLTTTLHSLPRSSFQLLPY